MCVSYFSPLVVADISGLESLPRTKERRALGQDKKKTGKKKNNEEELSKSASSAETGWFYRMKEAEFHC